MKISFFTIALALSVSPLFASEFIRGGLNKKGDDFVIVTSDKTELKVITTPAIAASLPSLEKPIYVNQSNGQKYAFEFKGKIQNNEFHLEEVPTNVAGIISVTGILKYSNGQYSINGLPVRFGYSKMANGYQFDEISKASFIGKEVIAEGQMDGGTLIPQALTPTKLFEATEALPAPVAVQTKFEELGAWDFLFKEIIKDEYSQMADSYRLTIAGDEYQVRPGESALIITLSGRQGDSFGSVNGHMVAGLAEVREDLTLRGEVSNAYVTNDKDILSANTSLTNYFSHFVQGQNNYRPTYTLIAYGVDKKKLKQFRDALEASHIQFRTTKLTITPQFNCTTESVKALRDAGIEGDYRQLDNFVKGIATFPLKFLGEQASTIQFSLMNDASRFQPRPAYNSFQAAFLKKSFRKKLGIKRVDFVFYSQIPSQRPVGGIALGRVFKALKFKKLYQRYEVNPKTKLSPEEIRPVLERELKVVPYL